MKNLTILGNLVLLILVVWCSGSWAGTKDRLVEPDGALSGEAIYWHEGKILKQAWMALDELAVFRAPAGDESVTDHLLDTFQGAKVISENDFVIVLKISWTSSAAAAGDDLQGLSGAAGAGRICPVFYTAREKQTGSRIIPTGEILVQYPVSDSESKIEAVEAEYGLERVKVFDFSPNTFLYDAGDALEAISRANELYESGEVVFAYPNWLRSRVQRSTRATPNDQLYPNQWHLNNTGQGGGVAGADVNITSVWDTYRGTTDEVIAITDDGLELAHEDIAPNVLAGYSWDWVDGDGDPTGGEHGHACAGVAAGRGFNIIGVSGAAPEAALVGHRLLGAETDANEADALTRNNDVIDINSNSWGPADDGQRLEGPGPLTEAAIESAITNGRGGLGTIFTWAGGNGNEVSDNANFDGYANSRYTIAVAASNDFGTQSPYSEEGADIVVNAPSNGGMSGITTTDRTAPNGYNSTGSYTDSFGGTSSAAPLAAGVIALMLQANPNLTWRDVIAVLVTSAYKNDPADGDWTANGANYHVNHKYGFGRIDAAAAVNTAAGWTPLGPEINAQVGQSPNLPIPENDTTGVTAKMSLNTDITIEYVEVTFSAADHTYWGDLEITLTSPSGTTSRLANVHLSGNTAIYNNWRFGSIRHFGESSFGVWSLTVKDIQAEDTGTFQSWTLKVYGTEGPGVRSAPAKAGAGGCFIQTMN